MGIHRKNRGVTIAYRPSEVGTPKGGFSGETRTRPGHYD